MRLSKYSILILAFLALTTLRVTAADALSEKETVSFLQNIYPAFKVFKFVIRDCKL